MKNFQMFTHIGGAVAMLSALVIARPARAGLVYVENRTEDPSVDEGLVDVHELVLVALAVMLILAGCAVAFYFAKFEAATGFAAGSTSALIGAVLVQASYANSLSMSQWLYIYIGTAFVGGILGRCMFFCQFTQVVLIVCTITLFDTAMIFQVSLTYFTVFQCDFFGLKLGIIVLLTAPWSIYIVVSAMSKQISRTGSLKFVRKQISLLLIANGVLAIVFLDLMKLLTGTSSKYYVHPKRTQTKQKNAAGAVMVSYGFAYFASPNASRTTFFLAGRGKPLGAYSCDMDLVCYAAFLAGLLTFIVSSSLHWHVRQKEKMKQKLQKAARGSEEKRTRFIRTVIPYKEGAAYV